MARMSVRSFFKLLLLFLLILLQPNSGCYTPWTPGEGSVGGADDVITIHMPFMRGYAAQCTQGVNGGHSHQGNATRNDLDFDTPNGRDDLVFAPTAGTAHVHDNPSDGFGRHINIDLHDGTYVLLAHLDRIFVQDEAEIGLGQVIAFEGTTGNSDGDHVHMGRHAGDPSLPAANGRSIATLAVLSKDTTTGEVMARSVAEYRCALSGGRTYASELPDVRSHPDGTLVQSPYNADVFIVHDARRDLFEDEDVFWSHNRSFADVVLVSPEELSCYRDGGSIVTQTQIRGAYDGSDYWLLLGSESDSRRYRQKMHSALWQPMLASWGVHAGNEGELVRDTNVIDAYSRRIGEVPWRDGAIVREQSRSDVYIVVGNFAFPVLNWDVFARLGLANHAVHTIPDDMLRISVGDVGNCVTGTRCVDHAFAESCGASLFGTFSTQTEPPGEDEDVEDDSDVPPEDGDTEDAPPADPQDTAFPVTNPPTAAAPLMLEWRTPGGVQAQRITLSGVYAPQGVEQWWTPFAQTMNGSVVTYTHPNMERGDYLRFSVEFVVGSQTSWSCLAPFPPGALQGIATATWNGQTLPVTAAGDPAGSPGCGLKVQIP